MLVDQAENDFRIRIQLAGDFAVAVPKRLVIDDDAVVNADRVLGDDGLVVAGDGFAARRHQPAVPDHGGGLFQAALGIHLQAGQGVGQKGLIGLRFQHRRGRGCAFEDLRRPVGRDDQPRGFAAARLGKPEQQGQRVPEGPAAAFRPLGRDEAEYPAHEVSLKSFAVPGQAPLGSGPMTEMEKPGKRN